MQDAVADVLAERSRRHALALSTTVFVSVGLHLALFGAVLASAKRATEPERLSTLNIRFASPAAVARPAAPVEPPPVPVVESKVTTPKPVPVVETPKEKTQPPEKKEAYAPKQESIFGRTEREVAPSEPRPAPPIEEEAAAVPAIGTTGVAGFEGGEFPYTIYVDQMLQKIGRNWFRPQAPGQPVAKVYFVIERNGRIREAAVTESSGHGAFDRAALRAILNSSPLAPLPLGYRGTWLGVHLTFH